MDTVVQKTKITRKPTPGPGKVASIHRFETSNDIHAVNRFVSLVGFLGLFILTYVKMQSLSDATINSKDPTTSVSH